MGLASQDNKARKDFRKDIAGKSDWKETIDSPNEAYTMIMQIKKNLEKDPNREYILEAYAGKQIRLLERYIKDANGRTLKQYCRDEKN